MHLLVVAMSFPSPEYPYRGSFIGQQVRLLCERAERIERITVLCPTTYVPRFLTGLPLVSVQSRLPDRYDVIKDRCEVLFPRYVKAPGDFFLGWTKVQWCRIVDQTISQFSKTCPISIIHANAGSVSSWAAICAARQHHVPCVVTYQGSEVHTTLARRRKGWKLCRDSFRLADLNLPVSRSLERILRSSGEPRGRCEVLLRGVDQKQFYPAPSLAASPRVLFVGRIEEKKGVFDLLAAWARVKLTFPDAYLTMVGPDHTNGLFAEKAKSLGLDTSITLTGPIPLSSIANLMRESRLLCLPSHAEGTPNCVMEGLASGLPVVATNVGGIPDIVNHGESGLIVQRHSNEDLSVALINLLRDYRRCVEMGNAAYDFARENLDGRKTVSRLLDLYSDAIAEHSLKSESTRTFGTGS